MHIALPEQVSAVIQTLNAAGFAAYAVGGCVRDSLMGRKPQDWDITTSALPEQMKQALGGCGCSIHDTGLAHGTITAVLDGMPIEITTFRVDGSYSDFRRPDSVAFTEDLRADLSRRDFTINAMAYHPEAGLTDCFGGVSDMEKRRIRCVGEPTLRLREDALRILRALRFASALDFSLEEQTAQACLDLRELLRHIAPERIGKELLGLLCGKRPADILLRFAPIVFVLLPPLERLWRFPQATPYHCMDVYSHSVSSVAFAPPDAALRMALLLHDIAKPDCLHTDAAGIAHFPGHAERSAQAALELLQSLRYPKRFCSEVSALICLHDLRLYQHPERIPHHLGECGAELFFRLLTLMRADMLAKSDLAKKALPALEQVRGQAQALLQNNACLTLSSLAVDGNDLLALGIPAGRELGNALQALLDAVMRGELSNNRKALLRHLKQHYIL